MQTCQTPAEGRKAGWGGLYTERITGNVVKRDPVAMSPLLLDSNRASGYTPN
jgi:hypothetical protein